MLLYNYYELLPLQSLRRTTLKVQLEMSLTSIYEQRLTLKMCVILPQEFDSSMCEYASAHHATLCIDILGRN